MEKVAGMLKSRVTKKIVPIELIYSSSSGSSTAARILRHFNCWQKLRETW
jgi:hypothetical protein